MPDTLPHTKSCFVCGASNPIGLHLRFETDGQIVTTQFTPLPDHAGFKHAIHGGLIATLLDEVMVWACAVRTKRFAVSAEMTVRYLQPVPPGAAITAVGECVENRRNRLFEVKAELRGVRGQVLATATGKYLPLAEHFAADLETELIGDLKWVKA